MSNKSTEYTRRKLRWHHLLIAVACVSCAPVPDSFIELPERRVGPRSGEGAPRPSLIHELGFTTPDTEGVWSIVKSPYGIRVTSPSGEEHSYEDLVAAQRARARNRLEWLPATGDVDVGIAFEAPIADARTRLGAFSPDPAERSRSIDTMHSNLAEPMRQLRERIRELGGSSIHESHLVPILVARVPAEAVPTLLASDAVVRLWHAPSDSSIGGSVGNNSGGVDPWRNTGVGGTFNHSSQGYRGAGHGVGVLEFFRKSTSGVSCWLRDDHVAFTDASFVYQLPPEPCPKGCPAGCGCVGNRCVDDHGSATASAISYSRGAGLNYRPAGASEVTFYYPNDTIQCNTAGAVQALDWLVTNGVRFAYDTSLCPSEASVGHVYDYYARFEDLMIFKLAGNGGSEGRTSCEATLNSMCVGASDSNGNMACFSSPINPPSSDREEPDITALGGQDFDCGPFDQGVCVADWDGSPTDWETRSGTSYSAPIAAGLAVLAHERCEANGYTLPSVQYRASFRTHAYAGNPDGLLRYSTPSPGWDFADGAGLFEAGPLYDFCLPGGGTTTTDGGEADGGTFLLGPAIQAEVELPGGSQEYDPAEPRDFEPISSDPPGSGRVGMLLKTFTSVDVGTRLRVSVSWNACDFTEIPADSELHIAQPDIDVFLFNATEGAYIYGSQSVSDVNEGFDVTIQDAPNEGPGTYEVWVSWPENSTPCPVPIGDEGPVGWSTRRWLP